MNRLFNNSTIVETSMSEVFPNLLLLLTLCALIGGLSAGCAHAHKSGETRAQTIPASAKDVTPLLVGDEVPVLTLKTVDGEPYDLNAAIKKKPTALIFYRGGWCIYCNRQMTELKQIEADLLEMGFNMIAVSPDRPEKLKESLKEHKVDYTLLSDSDMQAARGFGIAFRLGADILEKYQQFDIDLEEASGKSHYMLPVPSVFIIGTDGKIKYQYVNPDYQQRIDPKVLLAMAESVVEQD